MFHIHPSKILAFNLHISPFIIPIIYPTGSNQTAFLTIALITYTMQKTNESMSKRTITVTAPAAMSARNCADFHSPGKVHPLWGHGGAGI